LTDGGGVALDWLKKKFGEIYEKVATVVKDISDSFRAGGIDTAAKTLWANLRILWLKGVTFINKIWETVYIVFAETSDRIRVNAIVAWSYMTKAITVAVQSWYKAILWVAESISTAFWTSIRGIVNAFAWLAEKVVTAGYELHLIDENEVSAGMKFVEDLRKGASDFTKAQEDLSSGLYGGEAADAAKKIRDAEQEFNRNQSAEEQALQKRNAERDAAYLSDLKAAEKELANAQKEADDLKKKTAADLASRGKEDAESAGETLAEKVSGALSRAGESLRASAGPDGEASIVGGFDIGAFSGILSFKDAGRTAKATEETAKNTKDIAQKLNESEGLVFS
jgi:hypothetical protein